MLDSNLHAFFQQAAFFPLLRFQDPHAIGVSIPLILPIEFILLGILQLVPHSNISQEICRLCPIPINFFCAQICVLFNMCDPDNIPKIYHFLFLVTFTVTLEPPFSFSFERSVDFRFIRLEIRGIVWRLHIVPDIASNYIFLGSHVDIVVHIIKFLADPWGLATKNHVALFLGRRSDRRQVCCCCVQVRFFVFYDFVSPDLDWDLVGHVRLTVLEFIAIGVLVWVGFFGRIWTAKGQKTYDGSNKKLVLSKGKSER